MSSVTSNMDNVTSFPRVIKALPKSKQKRRKVRAKILTQPASLDVVHIVKKILAVFWKVAVFLWECTLYLWHNFSLSQERKRIAVLVWNVWRDTQPLRVATEGVIKKAPQWWKDVAPAALTSTMLLWCSVVGLWFFWKAFWGIFGITNLPFAGITWSEMLHAISVLLIPPFFFLCGAHWYEKRKIKKNSR